MAEDHQSSQSERGTERQHKRYRRFDEEFKREAVRLSEQPGRTIASVARSLDIDSNTLALWRKQFGVTNGRSGRPAAVSESTQASDAAFAAQQAELMDLRKRLREAEQERDILKKALTVFSKHQP